MGSPVITAPTSSGREGNTLGNPGFCWYLFIVERRQKTKKFDGNLGGSQREQIKGKRINGSPFVYPGHQHASGDDAGARF